MTVFVDNERIAWRDKQWCHLVADSLDELHSFAEALGLQRSWFQNKASYPHYDVTSQMRQHALRRGALPSGKAQIIASAKMLSAELRTAPDGPEGQATQHAAREAA